jgi:ubiquinol-cytochrome c reductase cytochrome b subunit
VVTTAADAGTPPIERRRGVWSRALDQLGFRQLVSDYLIPSETNSLWYSLGGVLAIALVIEIITGFVLSLVYVPDASLAFGTTSWLLSTPGWSLILNFHYYNAYLIFGLVMVHMARVFISGGYRGTKTGLWVIGVGLAAMTFVISLTGEALHWDEVGFGVPWNIGEFLDAIGLAGLFGYATDGLTDAATATEKLAQIYVVHVSIVPLLLGLLVAWHYLLIRLKGISVPYWMRASGRTSHFTEHLRSWALYGGILLGAVLLLSIALPRDPGTAPQLISSSPLYGTDEDPGGLGFKPTFPISWTRGMNIFAANLGIDPDIWGTVTAMAVLLIALLVIPFLDRGEHPPETSAAAFDWRVRGWAFLAFGVFWLVLMVGLFENAITAEG